MSRLPSPSQLGQRAYQHLQQKLWRGELEAGAKISESRLAKELGMSRTPVREAIARMEAEGMLHQVPSSGTFVTVPDRSAIVEAYEVRIAIECFAVQKATRRMKTARVLELQGQCDAMREAIREFRDSGQPFLEGDLLRRYLAADLEFHLLILQAAENRHALEIFNDVNLRSAIFGGRSHQRDLHHVAYVWRHHARVARAVRNRDAPAALVWLERHMQSSMNAALEAYDARNRERPTAPPSPQDSRDTVNALIVDRKSSSAAA